MCPDGSIPGGLYSKYDNPIQSLTWEDFSAYAGYDYTYHFTPLRGTPLDIKRGETISIDVTTEAHWVAGDHSVFFNRGVASSQAYAMKFGNKSPDMVADNAAYKWLSRGLEEALIAFVDQAEKGDKIYGCFYEFRYDGVLTALREAADRGVQLELIYDCKENQHLDKKTGEMIPSFPKVENNKACKTAGLDNHPNCTLISRTRNKSYISHNKFMVLEKEGACTKVWTGSTNISRGGIFGQANVGHAVDDQEVAIQYKAYWDVIKNDPDSKTLENFTSNAGADLNNIDDIPDGVTCIFSPRKTIDMLNFYGTLLDSATSCACITLAFGVNEVFVNALSDNTTDNALTFLLLEKDADGQFDYIYQNNVVKAVGSYIPENSLYKWVRETNTFGLKLNTNVMYIHSKFLLKDPLQKDCIIVTGSANFSGPSTTDNDENMMIIKGNPRVADIYFTEFLRLFNHYYFRWIVKKMTEQGTLDYDNPAYLFPSDIWTNQYKAGKYKRKRIEIFTGMHGIQQPKQAPPKNNAEHA